MPKDLRGLLGKAALEGVPINVDQLRLQFLPVALANALVAAGTLTGEQIAKELDPLVSIAVQGILDQVAAERKPKIAVPNGRPLVRA